MDPLTDQAGPRPRPWPRHAPRVRAAGPGRALPQRCSLRDRPALLWPVRMVPPFAVAWTSSRYSSFFAPGSHDAVAPVPAGSLGDAFRGRRGQHRYYSLLAPARSARRWWRSRCGLTDVPPVATPGAMTPPTSPSRRLRDRDELLTFNPRQSQHAGATSAVPTTPLPRSTFEIAQPRPGLTDEINAWSPIEGAEGVRPRPPDTLRPTPNRPSITPSACPKLSQGPRSTAYRSPTTTRPPATRRTRRSRIHWRGPSRRKATWLADAERRLAWSS